MSENENHQDQAELIKGCKLHCFSSKFKRSNLLGKRFFKGKLHTNKVKGKV